MLSVARTWSVALRGPHAVLVRRPGRGHGRLNLRPSGPKKLQGVGRSGYLCGLTGAGQVLSHVGVATDRLLPYYGPRGREDLEAQKIAFRDESLEIAR